MNHSSEFGKARELTLKRLRCTTGKGVEPPHAMPMHNRPLR